MNDVTALILAIIINTCTHYAELELSKYSNVRILSLDKILCPMHLSHLYGHCLACEPKTFLHFRSKI